MDRLVSRPAALRLGCVWTAKVQSAESIMLASCKTLANSSGCSAWGKHRRRWHSGAQRCVYESLLYGAWPWQARSATREACG